LPSLHDIRLPPRLPRLAAQHDPELDAWFDGTPYRTDLLQVMDQEVDRIAGKFWRRDIVTYPERKLISYCVWGNLVNAFKFYEYNFQETWLPHRYLPEHGRPFHLAHNFADFPKLTDNISHAAGGSEAAQVL
jgi:hypothetical protein